MISILIIVLIVLLLLGIFRSGVPTLANTGAVDLVLFVLLLILIIYLVRGVI
jgi:hypothetical protein